MRHLLSLNVKHHALQGATGSTVCHRHLEWSRRHLGTLILVRRKPGCQAPSTNMAAGFWQYPKWQIPAWQRLTGDLEMLVDTLADCQAPCTGTTAAFWQCLKAVWQLESSLRGRLGVVILPCTLSSARHPESSWLLHCLKD